MRIRHCTKRIAVGFGCFVFMALPFSYGAQPNGEDNRFIYPEYSKKISMDFKDAALTDVLKIFSKQSGMNFIAAQDAGNKKITLFLENIPVEEALEKILSANGLTYDMPPGSGIFVVKAITQKEKQVITRVYPLKYATVPSSKLNKTISISTEDSSGSGSGSSDSSGSSSGSSSSTSSSSSGSSGSSSGESGSSSGVSASNGIYAAVKAVLTATGILVEDPRTNSLIVTDDQEQFPLIEETIAKLDVPIPEILIEVEMLDVSKTTSDLMGVKFGSTPASFVGAQRNHLYPFDQNDILTKENKTTDASPELYKVGTLSYAGMTAVLNFLKTQTDTRNLARPRLLTLNNETAQIKISTNEAIGISTSTNTTSSTGTQTEEAERVQTGVFLTVTPQANMDTQDITMAVYPKVIQARTGATFKNTQFKDPEERGSQSILTIHDGETIIIGGLLRTNDSNTVTKIPFLGDIPILGAPFRHRDKSGDSRELIIFMTPHIMDAKTKERLLRKQEGPAAAQPQHNNKSPRSQEVNRALSTIEQQRF